MRWITGLVVAACSSGSPAPSHPLPRPEASRRATPPPAAQAAPSERECDELITHAVALGIDERREAIGGGDPAGSAGGAGGKAPREIDERREKTLQTTPADHEAVRRKLHEDFMAGCRALPRGAYRCAMAATSLPALVACQPTLSSSTSNSSVAPGGIAPPAPRSP